MRKNKNMKKLMAILTSLILVTVINGCIVNPNNLTQMVVDTKDHEEVLTVEEPEVDEIIEVEENKDEKEYSSLELYNLLNDLESAAFSIDGEVYVMPMSVEDFFEKGWEIEYSGDGSDEDIIAPGRSEYHYIYKGDKDISSPRVSVVIKNFDINNRTITDCSVTKINLSNGIKGDCKLMIPGGFVVGKSTYEEVTSSYGTPYNETEYNDLICCKYHAGKHGIRTIVFDNDTHIMEFFEIEYDRAPEGFETSELYHTIPPVTLSYITPIEMSDNPEDMIFEIDGDLYQLPFPVSEMIFNGWTLVDDKSDDVVKGNDYGKVKLRRKQLEINTNVYNFDDNATPVENAFIYSLSDIDFSGIKIVMPGGISTSTKKDEAKEFFMSKGFDFEDISVNNTRENLSKYYSSSKYYLVFLGKVKVDFFSIYCREIKN